MVHMCKIIIYQQYIDLVTKFALSTGDFFAMNTDSSKINNNKNDDNPMEQQSTMVIPVIEEAHLATESVAN